MEEGRHDWNINEITWDRNEMRAEWRGERSPDQSAGASSAQQVSQLAGLKKLRCSVKTVYIVLLMTYNGSKQKMSPSLEAPQTCAFHNGKRCVHAGASGQVQEAEL